MKNETSRKTKGGELANQCVQRQGRQPSLSDRADHDLAIKENDHAMSETILGPKNPLHEMKQSPALLNVDVLSILNLH